MGRNILDRVYVFFPFLFFLKGGMCYLRNEHSFDRQVVNSESPSALNAPFD